MTPHLIAPNLIAFQARMIQSSIAFWQAAFVAQKQWYAAMVPQPFGVWLVDEAHSAEAAAHCATAAAEACGAAAAKAGQTEGDIVEEAAKEKASAA